MWYRRALFALAVTGPAASVLVHCTEFGADGEPSTDASTTATATSTAPPIAKPDASAAVPDAAPPRDANAALIYKGETIQGTKATAPTSPGYFVHKRKGEEPWFFYLNNQNAIATADGGSWSVDQAARALAVLDSPAESRGARAGRLAAALSDTGQRLLIGDNNQEPDNVPKPYATVSTGASYLYIATSGAVHECSVNVVEATACRAVATGLSPLVEAFSVDADRFVLYRAEAGGADAGAGAVLVHRRPNATQSFSAGQRVAVSPPLPGPIVGAHENGFYTTTPREGGVGFMKYDLVPATN